MNWRKQTILAALAAMLFTATTGFGQAKPDTAKLTRAKVLLRFAKDGTVGGSCSAIVGEIQQSMLQIEGVKNVKADAKGVQVTFDPSKTNPDKIVTSFNKENPDALLQLSDSRTTKLTPERR
jgi:copper chaperone CopZ